MISTSSWIIICFILLILKYAFFVPQEDRRLFRMYEARDEVALGAFEKKIDQESQAYNYTIELINFELYYCQNDYDFFIIIKNLFVAPIRNKKAFNEKMELIEKNETLKKAFRVSYNEFISHIFLRTRIFTMLVLYPIYLIVFVVGNIINLVLNLIKIGEKIEEGVSRVLDKFNFMIKDCHVSLKSNPYNVKL